MASAQPEPSMEEILASIRRIISEDDSSFASAEDGDADPSAPEFAESGVSGNAQRGGAAPSTPDARAGMVPSFLNRPEPEARAAETPASRPVDERRTFVEGAEPAFPTAAASVAPATPARPAPNEARAAVSATSSRAEPAASAGGSGATSEPAFARGAPKAAPISSAPARAQSPATPSLSAQSVSAQSVSAPSTAARSTSAPANSPPASSGAGTPNAAHDEKLTADASAGVAGEAFKSLARTIRISGQGEKTLEDIVTDLLRPLVKEWLDRHLATIVEEKVQDEVERIARRGG